MNAPFALAVTFLAFIAETVLAAVVWAGGLTPLVWTAIHLGLAVACVLVLTIRAADLTAAVVTGLATLTMGPVGAFGAMLLLLRLAFASGGFSEDAPWYRRLKGGAAGDRAGELYLKIVSGRAYRPGAMPQAFDAILKHAPVPKRLEALAEIADRSDAFPPTLLEIALKSDEIAVRASAAAVHARLRDEAARAARSLPQEGVA